jgi:hypothetical protein
VDDASGRAAVRSCVRLVQSALVVALVTLGVGCSDDAQSARAAGQQRQQEAQADGAVSFEEYEDAFIRYTTCLTDAGYPPLEPRLDEATMLYDYRIVDAAVQSGVDMSCYEQEFSEVNAAWMGSDVRPRLPGEVRSVSEMLERCLERRDVAAPRGLEPAELEDLVEEYGLTADGCMQEYMAEVYPEE